MGIVTRSHKASYPDPLVITAGDVLQVGRQDETWPLYRWCTGEGGRSGWVPEIYLDQQAEGWVANQDYSTAELTVEIGTQLHLILEVGGWIFVELPTGVRGWVPRDYIEIHSAMGAAGDMVQNT
jgi:hypothetical protein